MSKPPFRLAEHEHVVTAYAQRASGPGWSNTPLWVIIQDGNGKLRRECLQPEEQTQTIYTLYGISHSVNIQLVNEVERIVARKKRKSGNNSR